MAKCMNCGEPLDGQDQLCSPECREEYRVKLKKRLERAVKNDTSHTEKMIQGETGSRDGQ